MIKELTAEAEKHLTRFYQRPVKVRLFLVSHFRKDLKMHPFSKVKELREDYQPSPTLIDQDEENEQKQGGLSDEKEIREKMEKRKEEMKGKGIPTPQEMKL